MHTTLTPNRAVDRDVSVTPGVATASVRTAALDAVLAVPLRARTDALKPPPPRTSA